MKKLWAIAVMIISFALGSCGDDDNGITRLRAELSGDQQVPPVVTDASGLAKLTLNESQTELAFELNVSGIDPADIIGAHIHVGPVGVNGPIILFLAAASFTSPLTGTLTAADLLPSPPQGINTFADAVAALLNGNTYVNVHTTDFPGGKIRGQVGG